MSEAEVHILVVDDERAIRRFLHTSLSAHGYTVQEVSTGEEALAQVTRARPDIMILDLGLPDIDGVDVVRRLREWTQLPIIILSVREHEQDKIMALDAGADDYLTKPFGVGELMARLRVALRRVSQSGDEPVIVVQDLTVDLGQRTVNMAGQPVQLTPTEYDLLRLLALHRGKVLTHTHLLQQVRGAGYENDLHLLRVNISNLRRKIEPEPARPRYIMTEPGVGYRFLAE
ncbi:MAG: response regulator [Caldilineaceae bacterium]|nr:response regulator [Caldilineaceae bacterium]